VTTDFPVLSAGPTPQIKLENWTLALQLGGSLLGKWNWAEFEALPLTTIKTDIHCVTKWSKLYTTWQGVTFDDLLKAVGLGSRPHPTSWLTARELTQQTSPSRISLAAKA
jgi:DMSO/TMAO reductase YedYZ molybdopterin-dependent catalytic subunit